ncbi:MAG: hypothetical protein COV36_01470 [Alphaproteobacteria bacterium CG11_big_fil_rev_8_21_14_0_20_44_7]|nr:MAG: hypothetical protein COV36_01470 [Alphaproteobacteria bacterium CG11_big_fil_rev_8_21_14_0_20_44_7]
MAARPSDKYIPLYIVAFFAVIFAVNAVFVYLATSTHTGVVTEDAYEKGLDYNKTIELVDKQNESGIEGQILVEDGYIIFKSIMLEADVTAYITRPTQDGYDYEIKLLGDKGYFRGKANFPMKGQWEIRVVAKWQENQQTQQYQKSKRVVVN